MKPKGLLIAVVLLAVLGGVTWWSNKTQADKAKAPAADAPAKLMCGIAGFVTVQPSDSPSIVERMTDTIRHRGPDDSGYYRDPWASLGFRRLAIIDVSGGHQPMANE